VSNLTLWHAKGSLDFSSIWVGRHIVPSCRSREEGLGMESPSLFPFGSLLAFPAARNNVLELFGFFLR